MGEWDGHPPPPHLGCHPRALQICREDAAVSAAAAAAAASSFGRCRRGGTGGGDDGIEQRTTAATATAAAAAAAGAVFLRELRGESPSLESLRGRRSCAGGGGACVELLAKTLQSRGPRTLQGERHGMRRHRALPRGSYRRGWGPLGCHLGYGRQIPQASPSRQHLAADTSAATRRRQKQFFGHRAVAALYLWRVCVHVRGTDRGG